MWLVVVGPVQFQSLHTLKAVMSDGNDGSGGGGGVRGDGGARVAGPQEPQTLGSRADQKPALSPGSAVQRAAGGGTEGIAGFWMETWPLGLLPSGVCCGCIAAGAGDGRKIGFGVASGTHPDPHVLLHCHCAAWSAEAGGSRGI